MDRTSLMSVSRILCVGMTLAAVGCASRQFFPVPTLQSQLCDRAPSRPYLMQPGDLISIKFYHNPELNEDVVIRPDGMISLQLVGEVRAAGRPPGALAADLTRGYAGELANPKVSVIVRQFSGERGKDSRCRRNSPFVLLPSAIYDEI